MALVMTPIYTQTVGAGGAASVTFNNIPQVYTDLKVVASIRSTGINGTLLVQFNNDTTNSNYSMTYMWGNGSSTTSLRYSAPYFINSNRSDSTTSVFNNGEIYIPNYTSNNFKQLITDSVNENNGTYAEAWLLAGLWRSTSAISSIKFSQAVDTGFAQHSTFSLYGIIRQGA